MVSQDMTLQVEETTELPVTPISGARQLSLLSWVDAQLMLVQEPGVVEQLFTLSARHLDYGDKLSNLNETQCNHPPSSTAITFMFFPVL